MSVTTTLKLPEALKKRISPLAEAAGKTPRAWMVGAIEAQASAAEKRRRLVEDALASAAEVEKTGLVYRAGDVHAYFLAKAAGGKARRPKPVRR